MIPAYRDATKLSRTIERMRWMALNPDLLEFIIHVADDDPCRGEFMKVKAGLVWGVDRGYLGVGTYFNRMFEASHGDLVWAATDDIEVLTPGWDEEYVRALEGIVYGVAGCHNEEGPNNPMSYSWAFPMVRRRLCEKMGGFCSGHIAYDRVYDAYAGASGLGVIAPVQVKTEWTMPEFGSQRDLWYSFTRRDWKQPGSNWKRLIEQWQAEGKAIWEKVKA